MNYKCYISGKITGIEELAPEKFAVGAWDAQRMGFEAVNPMDLEHNHDKSWEAYMKEDIKALTDCDAIYMLTNYKESKGACIELNIARMLGLTILFQT